MANEIESGIKALNPLNWVQYFVLIGIVILLILLVIFLFPCLLKCLFSSVAQMKQDVFELHFKNKKRGPATSKAVTPV